MACGVGEQRAFYGGEAEEIVTMASCINMMLTVLDYVLSTASISTSRNFKSNSTDAKR